MATRVSPPQNKTYYINPAYLTFAENSGYGANLIQVSASSSCYISVYDPANGISYSDADRNYKRWKVTAYNNKFPDNAAWNIYVRLERNGTSALVVYDKTLRGVKGGEITISKDEQGNDIYTEAETTQDTYWYIKIGEVGTTNGTTIREITYDTGYLVSDESLNDKTGLDEMWELDKYSTPWLIRAKHWLTSFTVKGFIKLIGGLIFQKGNTEKNVTDIRRAVDPDNEYLLNADGSVQTDAEGNPIKNPDFVPVSDETLPTTAYLQEKLDGIDDRYISKVHPDETEYRVKFKDGIEMGEFNTGMIGGSGAQIDRDGRGEMQSLSIREFLEVPELRFNRVDVVSGELWNSIAFGLVESVDTSRRICTLKLEEGELSGLKPNDICRGIFSDFGEGTVTEEGEDHNGFQKMYGFSTAYFTPTEILVNEAGRFQFRYNLQEGTTVHPCPSMKFAVYGNFIDGSRQASAYATRTNKIYLNKVNTWKVDPTRNYYAVFGKLDGISIGEYPLEGYGSFQHNLYVTGGHWELTPQQKEELKGEDAYSAQLSDYEGIIIIDDEGNVIGGEQMVMNVITGDKNVVTQGKNVTTSAFKLSTQVVASRGKTPLHYSAFVEEDGFTIGLSPVGCDAMVMNGVIVVTSIKEPKNCKINITVTCEGNWTTNLVYHITAVTDGRNPVVADLDNEMEAVACDPDGAVLFGLPVKTTVSMWAGTKQLRINRAEINAPEGVSAEFTLIDQNGKPLDSLTEEETAAIEHVRCEVSIPAKKTVDEVEVDGITKEAARTLPIGITVYAQYGSEIYHRNLTFTVNKIIAGENAVIYKLSPSVTSIVKDKSDNLSVPEVSCSVNGFNGKDNVVIESLPEHLRMECSVDGGEPFPYTMGEKIQVTKDNKEFAFALYQTSGEVETQIDYETVPLIRDGIEFKNVSAYIRSNEKPATPEGGTFANPKPDTEGWSLDIPEGENILWVSFRTFVSNDVYAEGDGWSEPSRMTDTATLKVVWSSKEEPADLPDAPEINDDWTDDPDANAIWRAETVNTNGVWSKWQVSKVRGKDALRLVASTATVSRNSFGSYQPSKVRVRVLRGSEEEAKYIYAWGIDKEGDAHGVELVKDSGANYIFASFADINMDALESADYASLVFRVYETVNVRDYKADDTESLDQVSIVFVGDGSSGPMPRNRGEYSADVPYFYNDMYRDFVWRTTTGGTFVYMRQGYGSAYSANKEMVDPGTGEVMQGGIMNIDPYGNKTYWIEVPKTTMTAIDTALIDNANIAGFMFKVDYIDDATGYPVGVIQSQNEKLKLDATNGKLTCVDAAIDGDITVGSLAYKVLYAEGGVYDLTGYGMVIGWGTFMLPPIDYLYSTEIKMFFENWGRALRNCTIKSGDKTPIRYMGESGYMVEGTTYELPDDNTLYSVILAYDSLDSSPYWMLSSSLGGSEGGGISLLVDSEMSETSEYPVQNKAITSELKKYVTLADAQEIRGQKNFTGGLQVNGSPIVYNSTQKYWKLTGDLLVTGGVTVYGSDSSFTPSTVMDAIKVDGKTIYVNSRGELQVIGGTGGGAESFWDLTDTPTTLFGYGITDAKISGGVITLGSNTITPLTRVLADARYVTDLDTSGNYLTWTKDGSTSRITVPYATKAGTAEYATEAESAETATYLENKPSLAGSGTTQITVTAGGKTSSAFTVPYATKAGSADSATNATTATNLSAKPSLATSGTTKITVTAGGKTSDAFTVPYASSSGNATTADSADYATSAGSATSATTASKLSTVSKTAWGQSYWTSGGVPTNVSGNMSDVGNISFNSNNTTRIGEWGKSAGIIHANIVSSGGDNHSLWLVGSDNSSNYGIVFARNTTGDASGEVARINSTSFLPYTSGGLDLGSSSKRWGDIYTDGIIDMPATNYSYSGAALCFKSSSTVYGRIGSSTEGVLGIYGRGSVVIRGGATGSSAPTTGLTIDASGNGLFTGGVTTYSDIRKKTKIEDVELTVDEVADAPLIKHYYNDDEKKTTHVGSVAQYWAETVGNDWFCKKGDDGFYTMEIQNAALASAISVAREFRRYKEETSALMDKLRQEMDALRQEIEQLKRK